MKDSIVLYRRLLGCIVPYRRLVVLSMFAMIGAAAMEPVLPALLKPLVDDSLIARDASAQWQVPLFLLLAFLAKGVAEYLANLGSQWVAQRAIADLRERVFDHQLKLSITEHQAQASGRMLSRILHDIPQVGSALTNAWIIVVRDTLIIVGLTAYLFWVAWELAIVLVLVAPPIGWLIRQASRKLRGGNLVIQRTIGHMTGTIGESLHGIREIKVFGTHEHEHRRFTVISERLRHETMRTVRVAAANAPLVQLLAASAVALVLWIASSLSAHDRLTPGAFVAFVAAMAMLFEPIRRLTNVNTVIQRGLAGAQSIFGLLDTAPEPDGPIGRRTRVRGEIVFENVDFRYPGQAEPALRGLDLHIRAGTTVALVGASGSGKTSVIQLIPRFFEPQQGRILLDDQPLRELPLGWLRAQIAWVGQHPVLFDASVAENIAYGHPNATEVDIIEAARRAHALEFISSLPQGLHTRVGVNGGELSGGQRQRIAIARAFLKQAPILLLDEATSALDNESDRAIGLALEDLRKNRSVVMVAHRLSTVRNADLIVVMAHGRIVEAGSHETLSRADGPYARLLASGDARGQVTVPQPDSDGSAAIPASPDPDRHLATDHSGSNV
ncbi:lipid A export permease/ATP-binding protein MsbA [Rhodocyclaceae bacterium SMB388]